MKNEEMSVFIFQAVGANGEKVAGELEAPNRLEAYRKLDHDRLQPVFLGLKEGRDVPTPPAAGSVQHSGDLVLSRRQIVLFTEELSDLLEAGLRLEPALRIMEQRQELSDLKRVVVALREQVVKGVSFSSALNSVSVSFGDLYCHLVAAGELSGALPTILRRQASYLAAMEELQSRVLQALIYPSFITGAAILLLSIFMTVLVPQLTTLFSRTGKQMPLPTRVLIGVSDFIARDWWVIVAGVIVLGLLFWRFLQGTAGRRWWDRNKLGLPVVGNILTARFYIQFAQTLSTLVGNGVPLLNGLQLMRAATINVHLRDSLAGLVQRVADGASLSRAMKQVGQFPPVFMDVVTVGEQTGNLGAALEKLARRYDKELTRRMERLAALIQPVIIVAMALGVGMVAYAIIAGIFQAVSGLRAH